VLAAAVFWCRLAMVWVCSVPWRVVVRCVVPDVQGQRVVVWLSWLHTRL
jgi:hypothetical protein